MVRKEKETTFGQVPHNGIFRLFNDQQLYQRDGKSMTASKGDIVDGKWEPDTARLIGNGPTEFPSGKSVILIET